LTKEEWAESYLKKARRLINSKQNYTTRLLESRRRFFREFRSWRLTAKPMFVSILTSILLTVSRLMKTLITTINFGKSSFSTKSVSRMCFSFECSSKLSQKNCRKLWYILCKFRVYFKSGRDRCSQSCVQGVREWNCSRGRDLYARHVLGDIGINRLWCFI
jgi:hypothetical protein